MLQLLELPQAAVCVAPLHILFLLPRMPFHTFSSLQINARNTLGEGFVSSSTQPGLHTSLLEPTPSMVFKDQDLREKRDMHACSVTSFVSDSL